MSVLRSRTRRTRAALLLLAAAACSKGPQNPARPNQPPNQPPALSFDFGVIPHGKARDHEFVLDTRKALGGDYVAIGVTSDCTCSRSELFLRDGAGHVRPIDLRPLPANAPKEGEVLVVHTQIDTAQKEPVDIGPVDSGAAVVLQPVASSDPYARVKWPLLIRYSVDSPVRVKPFAVLDFQSVPRSRKPALECVLLSDIKGRPIRFGPVHCDDPRFQCTIEPVDDFARLCVVFTPGADAPKEPFRQLVTIDTDLDDGYRVKLAAVGAVVDDFEAVPTDVLSFRADLRHEQPREKATSQFLRVVDHDESRPAEFQVARFVDDAGHDASKHFEVRFEPIVGDERSRKLFVRCLGGIEAPDFHAELVLAKDPIHGPFFPIRVVALAAKTP
jgi:hypothetical protein